ncbi:MAG: phage integrase N-terminal SAM-like domain-containing protein [Desulfobacterales bacterium]|nr:phage integrase N-terminal SAM-like domain-containing protein [Desulfobacterales bacterium]
MPNNTNRENTQYQTRPRLIDQVRREMRTRHSSPRTITTYVQWIKRFILFHTPKTPSIEREACP